MEQHAPETRAGISFTRYSFALDGPTFALFIRDQMEAAMREQAALEPGSHLDVPVYYSKMTGEGELWIGSNGLPLRQVLHIQFPEQDDEIVAADISVDFSHFGTPVVGLFGTSQLSAVLADIRNNPTPLLSVVLWSSFVVLLLRFGRSKRLQRILPPIVVVAIVLTPLMSGHNTRSFFAAQAAQAAEQDASHENSEMARTLKTLQGEETFDPHVSPVDAAPSRTLDVPVDNTTTNATSPAPLVPVLATDAGVDIDSDGLTDYLEERIGTDPEAFDTDGDLITDTLEVNGFSYNNQMWYPNPNALDSNNDSLSDTEEWFRDANTDGIPDDTDNDGVPDLFDDDNDGDGVPDRLDTAPLTQSRLNGGSSTPFSDQQPFSLTLKNLTPDVPTFVDFQLRPENPKHLWYANNILDWPEDRVGQMQDGDGATFADVAVASGREPTREEGYGDMKLVPMLEIRMNGTPTYLPPRADLTAYGVATNPVTTPFVGTVAYVPLTIVTDDQSGARVAFSARMPYRATSANLDTQQVRLVWVVQALVDACLESTDGQCSIYQRLNQAQVVQSYYDSWTLTGLNVREDHGVKTAIIYEDPGANRAAPAPDTNPRDDGALWLLADGLDKSFLEGRDCDTKVDGACQSDGTRDVRIEDIYTRFNWSTNDAIADTDVRRWSIPDVLAVQQSTFPTLDKAVLTTAVTDTKRILQTAFSPHWLASDERQVKPLLMFAREERMRTTALDALSTNGGYMTLAGASLVVDMAPAGKTALAINTLTGLKWQAYCGASASGAVAWSACAMSDYWQELERRYTADAVYDGETPDMAKGRVTVAQMYFMSLTQGVNALVQNGLELVNPDHTPESDDETDSRNELAVGGSHSLIMTLIDAFATDRFVQGQKVLQSIGRIMKELSSDLSTKVSRTVSDLKNMFGQNRLRGTLIVSSVVAVIGGLITTAGLLIKYYMAGNAAVILTSVIILNAIIVGMTLAFSVVQPIVSFVKAVIAQASRSASGVISTALFLAGNEGLKASLGSKVIGALGAVLAVGITWGFFIYSIVSSGESAFSPAFNRQFAEAIAATIYIIVTAIISLNPIGLIIVGIFALIDALLTAICELGVDELRDAPGLEGSCFTFGTAITKGIAKALYAYDSMIDIERDDMVVTGSPDADPTDPQLGFRQGNSLSVSMPVTTTIVHKDPLDENAYHILPYLYLFSEGSIKSSTFGYSLSQQKQTIAVERSTMEDKWINVQEDHKYIATPMYRGQTATNARSTSAFPLSSAGLNQVVPFYLNMGYAVPAYECWGIPNLLLVPPTIPVCYRRTLDGNTSTKLDAMRFDVFPSTLDGFMRLASVGNGSLRMAWDPAFRSIKDADGDSLLGSADNGLDPDDATWDADGDGLADSFELDRRAAGVDISAVLWDTDSDGLTDAQEIEFGTHPTRADTDNDGLLDGEEVVHLAYTMDTTGSNETKRLRPVVDDQGHYVYEGGWTVAITGVHQLGTVTVRVSSDPTQFDTDGDGISDQAEKELATGDPQFRVDDSGLPYHPAVVNQNPLKVTVDVSDADRIVRPGQTFAYTTTVEAGNAPFTPVGVVGVTTPAAFGPAPAPQQIALASGQTSTVSSRLTVTANATTESVPISSTIRTRLQGTSGPQWEWQPLTPEVPIGGNGSRTLYSVDVAPARADRQDSYRISSVANEYRGPGDVWTYEIPSGDSTTLDRDHDDTYNKQTENPSSVACNDEGVCMTVWDQVDNCNVVTVQKLRVNTAGSDPNGGIEPRVYFVSGGYEEFLWAPPSMDAGAGAVFDINPNITRYFCGEAKLMIYEADGSPKSEFIGEIRLNAGTVLDGVAYTNVSGSGHSIGLQLLTQQRNLNHLAAALTAPDTGPGVGIRRASYPLTYLPPNDPNYARQDSSPAIASDGENFLVAWMRRTPNNPSNPYNQLWTRLYDKNGNPLSEEWFADFDTVRAATADIEMVWASDHWRIAWRQHATTSPIRWLDMRADGARILQGGQQLNSNSAVLKMAYDPANNRTMIVYRDAQYQLRYQLFKGYTRAAYVDEPLPGTSGVYDVSLAYMPQTGGWLVGSTTGEPTVLRYIALRSDGTPLLTANGETSDASVLPDLRSQVYVGCPSVKSVPVGDYRFDDLPGATRFVDQSGYGRDGTTSSGQPSAGVAGSDRAPLSDYAVGFDGIDDSISIPYKSSDDWSVAFWLRTTETSSNNETDWTQGTGLVDGITDQGAGFGVTLGNGKVLFGTSTSNTDNASTISSPAAVNDGEWHFVVATRDRASNALKLYLDGNPTPVASGSDYGQQIYNLGDLRVGSLRTNQNFYRGAMDHLQLYETALSGDTVQGLYQRTLQSYCLVAGGTPSGMSYARMRLEQPDRRGGRLDATNGLRVQIDADRPTATITSFANNGHVQGTTGTPRTLIIGGNAADALSSISKVEVKVGTGAWQRAEGSASWSYALNVTQGSYDVRVRATDGAGNVGAPTLKTLIVDATAPTATVEGPSATSIPARDRSGQWRVVVRGTTSDPAIGAQSGSGVAPDTLKVSLQTGRGAGEGNGWQSATVTDGTWRLDYMLPTDLVDPTGTYTVALQVEDRVGNRFNNPASAVIRLDTTGPGAVMRTSDAVRSVITSTLTLEVRSRTRPAWTRWRYAIHRSPKSSRFPARCCCCHLRSRRTRCISPTARRVSRTPCVRMPHAVRPQDRPDCFDRGLTMAADQTVTVPNHSSLDFGPGKSFSLQTWIKTTASGRIISKANAQSVGYGLQLRSNGAAALTASSMTLSGGGDLRDNMWHHIVAVVDRKNATALLYVDGALRASQPTPPAVANSADLVVGGIAGTLDQVAVWNRALLAQDVAALYASPAAVKLNAPLTQRGAGVTGTTWRATVPTGLEGQYQIDLLAVDLLGNRRLNANVWRGVIDTTAPRVTLTARTTGAQYTDAAGVRRVQRGYACVAEERYLNDASVVCSNKPSGVQFSRAFSDDLALQALFPDLVQRTALSASYFLWEPVTLPAATARACDVYTHCTTTPAQAGSGAAQQAMRLDVTTAGLPQAVVVSPANERVVTTTGKLVVRTGGGIGTTTQAGDAQPRRHGCTDRRDGAVRRHHPDATRSDAPAGCRRSAHTRRAGIRLGGQHTIDTVPC